MSGDVQPRKRKEKRKKKEEVVEEFTNNFSSEENIHVHKDAGTGGNICAKIVFFFLLGVLLVLVGLIITEYRGSTDLDNPILESRWAPIFDGWVDDSTAKHDDHGEHEQVSGEEHGEDHDEHDEHDEHEEPDEHDEHDEHEEEEDDEEEGEEEGEPSEEGGDVSGEESPEPQADSTEASGEEQKDEHDNDNDDDDDDDDDDNDEDEAEDDTQSNENAIPGVTESEEDGDNQDDEDEGEDDGDDDNNDVSGVDLEDNQSGPKSAENDDEEEEDDNEGGNGDDEDEDENNGDSENAQDNTLQESGENENDSQNEDADGDDDDDDEGDDEPEPLGASSRASPGNDESEEEEAKPSQSPARGTVSKGPSQGGGKSRVEDDWVLQNDLNNAEADLDENPEAALKKFTSLVMKFPDSLPARYGRAKALDSIAELKRSNPILDQAIEEYQQILNLGQIVPDDLFLQVADRCINRMRFKGQHLKAVPVHKSLMARFPDVPTHSNQLAVTYLIINRVNEAKQLLQETLKKWPNDGFAQVHYGFILKTAENDMAGAVQYLEKGIRSREMGTIDGRFFFQLGDALMRLGRKEEAMKVHELGVKEGLFLSKYQRSLYNVDRLHGQPWWTLEETTYASNFKMLLNNWKTIQKEGLNALYNTSLTLYKDESENLKDFGQWKQLELFARGRKIVANCNVAPVTCGLIEKFPAARYCKRGQVKFSVMHPGTHVWPHCGPTNCRLRAHLGLVVPQNTFIRVAEETRSWEEGRFIVFDDSYEHEVWHNGSTTRLVLIVDVWHPGLTEEEKSTLTAI